MANHNFYTQRVFAPDLRSSEIARAVHRYFAADPRAFLTIDAFRNNNRDSVRIHHNQTRTKETNHDEQNSSLPIGGASVNSPGMHNASPGVAVEGQEQKPRGHEIVDSAGKGLGAFGGLTACLGDGGAAMKSVAPLLASSPTMSRGALFLSRDESPVGSFDAGVPSSIERLQVSRSSVFQSTRAQDARSTSLNRTFGALIASTRALGDIEFQFGRFPKRGSTWANIRPATKEMHHTE